MQVSPRAHCAPALPPRNRLLAMRMSPLSGTHTDALAMVAEKINYWVTKQSYRPIWSLEQTGSLG